MCYWHDGLGVKIRSNDSLTNPLGSNFVLAPGSDDAKRDTKIQKWLLDIAWCLHQSVCVRAVFRQSCFRRLWEYKEVDFELLQWMCGSRLLKSCRF